MKKIGISLLILLTLFLVPTKVIVNAEEDDYVVVAETTKYYKTITYYDNNFYSLNSIFGGTSQTFEITEEEYLAVGETPEVIINNSTTIETTYKRMTTYIESNGSGYRYKNILSWKLLPSVRSYDVIGIGHIGNVEIDGTPTYELKYCRNNNGCTTTSLWGIKQTFSYGASTTFQLPSYTDLTTLKITYYYNVKKINNSTTIPHQAAYGDYAHAITSVPALSAINHEVIGSIGIDFDANLESSYDTMNVASVYWDGTW